MPRRHDWVYVDGSRDEFLVIAADSANRRATIAKVQDSAYTERSVPIEQLTFCRRSEEGLGPAPTPQGSAYAA